MFRAGVEYFDKPHDWKLRDPRKVDLKNLSQTEIREIVNKVFHVPSNPAEDRARESIEWMRKQAAIDLVARRDLPEPDSAC